MPKTESKTKSKTQGIDDASNRKKNAVLDIIDNSSGIVKIVITVFLVGLTGYVMYALVKEFQVKKSEHPQTKAPTRAPTNAPTNAPTDKPINPLTVKPTTKPTQGPTKGPTNGPTQSPTQGPTQSPTQEPTFKPKTLVTQATPGKIWAEGLRAKVWMAGMGDPTQLPVPFNLTFLGNARYISQVNNIYIQLMDGGADQSGRVFFSKEGTYGPLTCWELRVSIKINNMAAADHIYLFGNESDTSNMLNTGLIDGDGISAGVDIYNAGNEEDKMYVGRGQQVLASGDCAMYLYGDTYKTYVLRRFGDKGEFFIQSEGSGTANSGLFFSFDPTSMPNGNNFGVAARCGTQTMIPEVQYIELRYIDQ